jgi:hypothetical protein
VPEGQLERASAAGKSFSCCSWPIFSFRCLWQAIARDQEMKLIQFQETQATKHIKKMDKLIIKIKIWSQTP